MAGGGLTGSPGQRRLVVALAILCALAIAGAVALGSAHGQRVRLQVPLPYEFANVAAVSLLLAAQAGALFWLLARAPWRSTPVRVITAFLASVGMLLAAFVLSIDSPECWTANLCWCLAMAIALLLAAPVAIATALRA